MTSRWLVENLLAAGAQGMAITGVAAILARVLPIDRPKVTLAWWQAVLAVALCLPWLGWWSPLSVSWIEARSDRFSASLSAPSAVLAGWVWADAVAVVLAVGAVLRGVRVARGLARLHMYRKAGARFDDRFGALASIQDRLGVQAEILLSRDAGVPATFGARRPVVLVPHSILQMDPEGQRAVLAHELIHVRRGDWRKALLEEALAAVLWFHPAVHWILGRIRLAREQCVDETTVATFGGRQAYLESLVAMARERVRMDPVPAPLFLREGHLSERVELLLKEVTMSKVRALSHLVMSALVTVGTGALASSSFPLSVLAGGEKDSKAVAEKARPVGEPRAIHKVVPVYPPDAKKDHITGLVHIDIRLAKDGSVAEAKVKDGAPILAEAALPAVRQWRYEPYLGPDKKPIEVSLTVTINFNLAD